MQREQLRRLSRVIFKHSYKLELMLATGRAPSGHVCLTDLAAELALPSASNIQGPLKDLARAGLITRLPQGDSRRQFYRREESLAWLWVEELHAACMGLTLTDHP